MNPHNFSLYVYSRGQTTYCFTSAICVQAGSHYSYLLLANATHTWQICGAKSGYIIARKAIMTVEVAGLKGMNLVCLAYVLDMLPTQGVYCVYS